MESKGIVLIIGCGRFAIQRIAKEAEMLLDGPIYSFDANCGFKNHENVIASLSWPRRHS